MKVEVLAFRKPLGEVAKAFRLKVLELLVSTILGC